MLVTGTFTLEMFQVQKLWFSLCNYVYFFGVILCNYLCLLISSNSNNASIHETYRRIFPLFPPPISPSVLCLCIHNFASAIDSPAISRGTTMRGSVAQRCLWGVMLGTCQDVLEPLTLVTRDMSLLTKISHCVSILKVLHLQLLK